MGLHSTVFGPVKYAILPQHLTPEELVQGTGLVEGATFVAILLGQIAGGLLPPQVAGLVAIGVALVGWLASRGIPPAPPEAGSRFVANPLTATRAVMAGALASREVTIATLAISWFWALGAIYTSQFVPLAHGTMGGSEGVATLFLATFSIGIAAGSVAAHRLTRSAVSTRLVPWAAAAMALAGIDLWWAGAALGPSPHGVADVLADVRGWRVLADLLVMAVAGGIFSVPLYAVLQTATGAGQRAGAIAANNIANSLFQVLGVLAIGAVVSGGAGLGVALAGTAATALLLVPLLRGLPR